MRGIVHDRINRQPLANPVPLGSRLPGILQEDQFLMQWIRAFDDSIAPVYAVLDNLDSYVRPTSAPADFLDWLAAWVDVALDDAWSEEQRRSIVAGAAALHRRAGTPGGIREALRLAAGPDAEIELEESGATAWSPTPGAPLPGSDELRLAITITVPKGDRAELQRRFERVAAAVVPAHLPMVLTVVVAG
ncbi:phage tail protein [Agromyces sp. M3QZ16-3]|uniref:phage tail protein n=1 Tax=Agromyces sp. M3QZ16-3 TaxID=3447585 RepID=UPI003F68FE09